MKPPQPCPPPAASVLVPTRRSVVGLETHLRFVNTIHAAYHEGAEVDVMQMQSQVRVQGAGRRAQGRAQGYRVLDLLLRIKFWDLGFMVYGLGLRVWGSGFTVWGLWFGA